MDLEQRLVRLERANRRMKRIGALVLMVAAAVVLSGAADGKDLPDLEVGSLTLKDKDGKTRALLGASADGAVGLLLTDKDGKTRAYLVVEANGSPVLALTDKDGKRRASLYVGVDGSPALVLYDKGRRTLFAATLGVVTTVDKRTGAKTTTTAGALTLFDAKGDVLWQAPR